MCPGESPREPQSARPLALGEGSGHRQSTPAQPVTPAKGFAFAKAASRLWAGALAKAQGPCLRQAQAVKWTPDR